MSQTLPTQPFGPDGVPVSRIALGCMGLAGTWNPAEVGPENRRRAIAAFEAAIDAGITFYDHADIYGGTACESIFKDCLAAVPGSRERIFIATKVGIRSGYYDHSPEHIRKSIRGSLDRMGIDYVDLYQLHRPDPLSHPAETAAVLDELVDSGLVRTIGVSNYYPHQVLALKKYLKAPIVSNQISLSLLRLDPIYEGAAGGRATGTLAGADAGDGVLDQCLELGITPLAYSPLAWGLLTGRRDVKENEGAKRTLQALQELSPKYGGALPGKLALAWLLAHPAKIIPLVGSNNPEHIREAAAAADISLSREDWYKLWVAARGVPVP
ncbi:MAG TPA: aldo/keto reductase [Chthonomonadaceae bacterium]|nr:aldo/keto reductase [Chthonomonadaceae bacterium]